MINLIGFALLVVGYQTSTLKLSSFYECSCQNLQTDKDCILEFCNWDSDKLLCQNKSCEEFNKGDCQGVPDPFKCTWNYQLDKCEQFTKCSDYSFLITQANRCYELIKCQADVGTIDITAGTIKCMNKSNESAKSITDCDKIPYDHCDWLVTDDEKECIRNKETQACETRTITQCSDYKRIDECDTSACYWNDTCKALECSILPEESCQFYFSIDSKDVTLCTWNQTQCVDLEPENLDQYQCLSYTLYSYAWNPSSEKCEICIKSSRQKRLFFFGFILLALSLN
ncbi:unnamed protein product [Paramecium octaurelia]|uniref:Mini antigen n=1 Tax=Paramecium octaurelia TaxID=43137 RepID=A0A8S1X413_PAROT|nr:unnamed protein product [Paramecium octaurelia]